MSKKSNPSPRTFGRKLLEPKGSTGKIKFPVTTRMCDLELFKRTGEIRYIDEEGTIMSRQSTIESAKKMRKELTTLAQFDAIGKYSDVAKHYGVHVSTAHAHLMHLRAEEKKAAKKVELEEKTMIQGPSQEEIEKFHTDVAVSELPKVELNKPVDLITDEQNGVQDELDGQVVGDCAKEGNQEEEYNESSREALERFVDTLEQPDPIESMWKVIECDLEIIRKMYFERAEKEFSVRKSLAMANA